MNPTLQVVLLTTLAGATIPLGGWLARIESIRPRWLEEELRHGVIAFGGGVLVSAVALVLVPEGIARTPLAVGVTALLVGGAAFMALDLALARSKSQAANFVAMLADFLPEAAALGASCVEPGGATVLLAVLIALQNLPEGFNSYREIRHAGLPGRRALLVMAALVPLGPIAGLIGLHVLAGHDLVIGVIMLVTSGGILYLMFQDIAPESRLERRWAPPLGAVLGFAIGLVGHELIQ